MAAKVEFPFFSQFFNPRRDYAKTTWHTVRHTVTLEKEEMEAYWQRSKKDFEFKVVSEPSMDLDPAPRPRLQHSKTLRTSTIYTEFGVQPGWMLFTTTIGNPSTRDTSKAGTASHDGAIKFKKGKPIGKVPWMWTYQLDKHLRQMLLTWFFGIEDTVVTFHEHSFKIVYVKHPSLMEAICNHKAAIQDWSDDITPPSTCATLKKFPSARATPNLNAEHWVLDGALLAPLLPGQLAQVVGGSLNNKFFPNKKDLKKLFIEAIHNWSKLNSIPCPPDHWVLQHFEPIWQNHHNRITEHLTAATIQQLQEQFKDCIFHNEDKRASSLRIFCPCQYF